MVVEVVTVKVREKFVSEKKTHKEEKGGANIKKFARKLKNTCCISRFWELLCDKHDMHESCMLYRGQLNSYWPRRYVALRVTLRVLYLRFASSIIFCKRIPAQQAGNWEIGETISI